MCEFILGTQPTTRIFTYVDVTRNIMVRIPGSVGEHGFNQESSLVEEEPAEVASLLTSIPLVLNTMDQQARTVEPTPTVYDKKEKKEKKNVSLQSSRGC